ncbi:orotate phosphoribosyltransferase [Methyloterricola oryzae]|uniref:orotate phosphoribosyltransferase n=1 Tax=Methyloterricola oryzae TaxID=1495050 RepID=UPI0005EB2C8D|nr:orotate phosphoribosyltransferase [Methyloterricola oryzae]
MQDYQHEFIEYAVACGVLRFGSFTLKSGRTSPYFFNTGLFDTGARLGRLGEFYARALIHRGLRADVLYGPAYKGIPLVCTTAIALARQTGEDVPFAFNRKEAKDHGEGGHLVGSALLGSVLILDDVITAGTSVRESVAIIESAGARPCGVLISLDRQETGPDGRSAVEDVRERFGIDVYSIVTVSDVIEYLRGRGQSRELDAIQAYRAEFGAVAAC